MKRVGGGHAMPLSLLSAPQHKASEEVIEASQLKKDLICSDLYWPRKKRRKRDRNWRAKSVREGGRLCWCQGRCRTHTNERTVVTSDLNVWLYFSLRQVQEVMQFGSEGLCTCHQERAHENQKLTTQLKESYLSVNRMASSSIIVISWFDP